MEEWHHCPPTKQLLNHSRQLERELAEAKAWSNAADDLDRQLTAHKAALEKCEAFLNQFTEAECSLTTALELIEEIKKLKGPK
jgi:hypothetical protein